MAVKIFCCYAREDEGLLDLLLAHLSPLVKQGLIEVWHDRAINAGAEWEVEIKKQLEIAEITLLLISPAFIRSDYCYGTEFKKALERHKSGKTKVISIILRPVYWQELLGNLQALPKDGLPVTDSHWQGSDNAFLNVVEGLLRVIKGLLPTQPSNVSTLAEQPKKPEISQSTTSLRQPPPPAQSIPTNSNQQRPLNVRPPVYYSPTVGLENIVNRNPEERRTVARDFVGTYKPSRIGKVKKLTNRYVCPSCFQQFSLTECRVVSRKDPRNVLMMPPKRSFVNSFISPLLRPTELSRPEFVLEGATYQCPICGYLLPHNSAYAQNINIGIVGTPFSGVSHFMAAIIHQLRQGHLTLVSQPIQSICLTADEESEFIRNNIEPLFHGMQVLPASLPNTSTQNLFRPLIYELQVRSSKRSTQSYNLTFYNIANEDYAIPERAIVFGRNILHADALIFLIDPVIIPRFSAIASQSI